MDLATLIGYVFGFICIAVSILLGGTLLTFIDIPSIFIVFGGTISATLVNFPLSKLLDVVAVVKNIFFERKESQSQIVDQMVELAEKARREGILAIEPVIATVTEPFIRDGLQLVVDGFEAEVIRSVLENDISQMEARHKSGQKVIHAAGLFAPAFGMIGTLIGLINMLRTLDDPTKIGAGMAVALITTFYGALIANLVLIPLEGKLKDRSEQEVGRREMIISGIMALQSGENPRVLRSRLQTFIAPKARVAAG